MSQEGKKLRAMKLLRAMKRLFPDAQMMLRYGNHWELLVAVQLSAQCTDKKVNEVTEKLFQKYKTLEDYISADPREFEQDIFQTGFYKNKTKNILAAARMYTSEYAGVLPRTMTEMLRIPGVGRKTANVVLGNAYGIAEGIAVDTHVKRLVKKFGLSSQTDPVKIERELMKIIPKKDWFRFTYYMIEFGRRYCPARRHDHKRCETLVI